MEEQRVIKFRVWDLYNEKMIELGDLEAIHLKKDLDFANYKVMQFTGLFDSTKWEDLSDTEREDWLESHTKEEWKGKEIYEGDIVKFHYFGFDGSETDVDDIGKIIYRKDGMCFVINTKDVDFTVEDTSNYAEPCIEVIGNIYENSDLLKD